MIMTYGLSPTQCHEAIGDLMADNMQWRQCFDSRTLRQFKSSKARFLTYCVAPVLENITELREIVTAAEAIVRGGPSLRILRHKIS